MAIPAPPISYADVAVLALAAATLVVTGLGILLAIASFIGWNLIKRAAINHARVTAERALEEHLASDQFRATLQRLVEAEVAEQLKETLTITVKSKGGGRRGGTGGKASFDQ